MQYYILYKKLIFNVRYLPICCISARSPSSPYRLIFNPPSEITLERLFLPPLEQPSLEIQFPKTHPESAIFAFWGVLCPKLIKCLFVAPLFFVKIPWLLGKFSR